MISEEVAVALILHGAGSGQCGADLLTKDRGSLALPQAPAAGRHDTALVADAVIQAERALQQEVAWRLKAMPLVVLPIPNG